MRLHTITCETCGQTFHAAPAAHRRFCSLSCVRHPRTLAARAQRFGIKVERTHSCWLWLASRNSHGYGTLGINDHTWLAHRYAWLLVTGDDPGTHHVCHTCDTRHCVRNDDVGTYEVNGLVYPRRGHLFLADNDANGADMWAKGRASIGEHHSLAMPHGDAHWSRRMPERVARGDRKSQTKVSDAQARELKQQYEAGGISLKALGALYGLRPQAVWDAIHRPGLTTV